MGGLRGQEILIIVILLILVFGWKRLPDAARSLGRSARVFKSEVEEMRKDGKEESADGTVQSQTTDQHGGQRAPQQVPPPPVDAPYQPQYQQPQYQQPEYQQPEYQQPEYQQPQPQHPQAQQPQQRPDPQTPDDPTRPVA